MTTLFSCQSSNDKNQSNKKSYRIGLEPEVKASIVTFYELSLNPEYDIVTSEMAYLVKNKDEILKTLAINDTIKIKDKNIMAVFYSYSIGSDVYKDAKLLNKIDGVYTIDNNYYSTYEMGDKDYSPFKNNDGGHGLETLKKMDEWKESSAKAPYTKE